MFNEEDIHNGLTNAEARTFLAKKHAALLDECSSTSDYMLKRIAALEAEVEEKKKWLLIAQQREAIELIISSHGWDMHNIENDIIEFDDVEFPFIGTKKEFDSQFRKHIEVDLE